jgi:hypothetical protein
MSPPPTTCCAGPRRRQGHALAGSGLRPALTAAAVQRLITNGGNGPQEETHNTTRSASRENPVSTKSGAVHFTSVSWEQVVSKDPQCIIINDYGTPTAAQKQKFLETSPITRNLTAVKNHCFLSLSYDQITPGPRNAPAVTAIAHWLHPAAFGLPPDGST